MTLKEIQMVSLMKVVTWQKLIEKVNLNVKITWKRIDPTDNRNETLKLGLTLHLKID